MAIEDITKPMALDETLQATNTALGLLGKDTTLQSIVTALAGIGVNTVGNLASLVTNDKTSLVGAVNEVAGDVSNLDTDKADKVSSATSGNLAGLDPSGNLTDAGWASDKTTTSATGNPISISGLKSNQLAINPIITFEPIQAGSGDPSPSNVRAISGYDKIEVLSCGKNLCRMTLKNLKTINTAGTWSGNSYTMGNVTYTVLLNNNGDVSGINVNGTCNGISEFYLQTPVYSTPSQLGLELNTVYKFTNNSTVAFKYDSGGNWSYPIVTTQEVSFTFTDNTYSYRPILQVQNGVTVNNVIAYPMCRDANTIDNTYEPYHKTTDLSLQIGQTVYGGTLDVEKGVLTVDKKCIDLGDLEWQRQYEQVAGVYRFLTTSIINDIGGTITEFSNYENVICSIYENHVNTDTLVDNICFVYFTKYLYVYDSRYTDATEFKTAVTGQKLCYELAEPFTIQLTPHEISLLKDYAYVSTNGTNIQFSYHNGELASLVDVSQLGETVNELSEYVHKINIPSTAFSFISSVTLAFTGCSIAIPANSLFELHVHLVYVNNAPLQLVISTSDDAVNPYLLYYNSEVANGSINGRTSDSPLNLYIWARHDGAGNNFLAYDGWYSPIK